jgi:hypothetical protein
MAEQEISIEKIDEVVANLPTFYIGELSRICFGRATKGNIRKIKYWRSGQMRDHVLVKKIFSAAQKMQQKYAAEAAA